MKAEAKPIVLEPKPMPYLQHLHSSATNTHLVENNNLVEHNVVEEDTKDPLCNDATAAAPHPTPISTPAENNGATAGATLLQQQESHHHVNFFPSV